MPPGIDMDLIREALASRAQGLGVPAINQLTTPTSPLPTGGANTINPSPAPIEAAPSNIPVKLPPRQQTGQLIKSAQLSEVKFNDPELAALSKAMITRLLRYI
jgi:hypothetical protein